MSRGRSQGNAPKTLVGWCPIADWPAVHAANSVGIKLTTRGAETNPCIVLDTYGRQRTIAHSYRGLSMAHPFRLIVLGCQFALEKGIPRVVSALACGFNAFLHKSWGIAYRAVKQ